METRTMLGFEFVCFLAFISGQSTVIADNKVSNVYTVVRRGEAPFFNIWKLATLTSVSVIKCTERCMSLSDSIRCRGFIFQPDFCGGNNDSPTRTGVCQLVQFNDTTSMLFGPANSSCQLFYVSSTAVTPLLPNLAFKRPSLQSSDYNSFTASLGNDGDATTKACTGTSILFPWWAVDLSQPTLVHFIKLTNEDIVASRLNNLYVGLTNTKPVVGKSLTVGTNYTVCAQFSGNLALYATVTINCTPTYSLYRYLIIQLSSSSSSSVSAFCVIEVQVF